MDNAKKRPRWKTCLLIALLMPAICYGAMWVFARFGGELVTSADLPVPEGSQFVMSTYSDGYYTQKSTLYTYPSTPEALREWFIQAGFSMSPIPLDFEHTRFIDYPNYYGTTNLFHVSSLPQVLHKWSVYLTSGWFDEMVRQCQAIHVYKNTSATAIDFPEITIPEGVTAFVITTCWPNID